MKLILENWRQYLNETIGLDENPDLAEDPDAFETAKKPIPLNFRAAEAEETIETKEAHYWSRSRKKVWHKGEASGFIQKVTEVRIDDDQDSIWLTVDIGDGSSCHVGYRSCFYRSIPLGKIDDGKKIEMKFEEKEKKFDPDKVYKDQSNRTKI